MILRTTHASPQGAEDYYVRMNQDELQELRLDHQWSQWPANREIETLGYTEWAGTWRGAVVSVACFWAVGKDGKCKGIDPYDVSTNLMLVDPKGFDAGTRDTACALMAFIRTSLINESRPTMSGIQQLIASVGPLQ